MRKITTLAAAISLTLLAGNALANPNFIPTAPNATPTPSSVVFTAIDGVTNQQFAFDLAIGHPTIDYSSFISGTITTLSWNLNTNGLFGAIANDNLSWTITASEDLTSSQNNAAAKWGVLTTDTIGANDFAIGVSVLRTAGGGTGNIAYDYASILNQQPGTFNNLLINDPTDHLGSLNKLAQVGGGSNWVQGDRSVDFYLVTNPNLATKASLKSNNLVTDEGTFTLTGTTLNFVATGYTPPSAVAEPESYAMLLLGLAGISLRLRKNQK